MGELSPKRQRFVDEYLIDLNGTQAAIRAGYSARTANEQAAALLAIPNVREAVEAGRRVIAERNAITQDRIRQELAKLAFADLGEIYDASGNLKPVHEMSREARAVLSGIETSTRRKPGTDEVLVIRKVKRWDKVRALQLLGQDLGMFNPLEDRLTALERLLEAQGIRLEVHGRLRSLNGSH